MTLQSYAKRTFVRLATSDAGRMLLRGFMADQVVILMLHRFADPNLGNAGHDPAHVRRVLETLRRDRIPLISMRSVVEALQNNEPVSGVVFTIDDGYCDFDTVGAAIFAAFDCPVSVYLATGFLDGQFWYWWDKINVGLSRTPRTDADVPAYSTDHRFGLRTPSDRHHFFRTFGSWIKTLPQPERMDAVGRLLAALDVEPSDSPPPMHAPMTWDQVRSHTAAGVDFGPHSVNHSSLATLSDDEVGFEIRESYKRLQAELDAPLSVFCYPYGLASDVSKTVSRIARAEGMSAAVTAMPGYVSRSSTDNLGIYELPRFALPAAIPDLHQITSGIERFKRIVRGAMTSPTAEVKEG